LRYEVINIAGVDILGWGAAPTIALYKILALKHYQNAGVGWLGVQASKSSVPGTAYTLPVPNSTGSIARLHFFSGEMLMPTSGYYIFVATVDRVPSSTIEVLFRFNIQYRVTNDD
jgi:hypothetical protein